MKSADKKGVVDVLCIGHACWDLNFSVDRHPEEDEKTIARTFSACGGGPAANAAVAAARLGVRAAFAGYLGEGTYGDLHLTEFSRDGVDTTLLVRGSRPTPLSISLIKPDGKRALVNYRGETLPLAEKRTDCSALRPGVMLFDGHEPHISRSWLAMAESSGIPTVLDAGSLHEGTRHLCTRVTHLVASSKFAASVSGEQDPERSLGCLAEMAPVAVVTMGADGLLWQRGAARGRLPAFPVKAVDTTGAGDTFHGAYAAGLAMGMPFNRLLRFASAAAALCCSVHGARRGIPTLEQTKSYLQKVN